MVLRLLFLVVILCGCSNLVLEHAQKQNPNCKVEEIESTNTSTTVEITCPYNKPFTKIYRKQK